MSAIDRVLAAVTRDPDLMALLNLESFLQRFATNLAFETDALGRTRSLYWGQWHFDERRNAVYFCPADGTPPVLIHEQLRLHPIGALRISELNMLSRLTLLPTHARNALMVGDDVWRCVADARVRHTSAHWHTWSYGSVADAVQQALSACKPVDTTAGPPRLRLGDRHVS
jgi:hypothetical protein